VLSVTTAKEVAATTKAVPSDGQAKAESLASLVVGKR